MSIPSAQGPKELDPALSQKRVESEHKIWKIVKNIFIFSILTGTTVGSGAGLHLRPGEISLLVLVPGSGYALSCIPFKGVKTFIIGKAKGAIEEQKEIFQEAAGEGVKKLVGENRPDLGTVLGDTAKDGVAYVADVVNHKVAQMIDSTHSDGAKEQKEDTPQPLNAEEATAWINKSVDGATYPKLNEFFINSVPKKPEGQEEEISQDKWAVEDPAYQLLLNLDKGLINIAGFMEDQKIPHEVLQDLVRYKSDHFFEEQSYQLEQTVNRQQYPHLHEFLQKHIQGVKATNPKNAEIFASIQGIASGNIESIKNLGIEDLNQIDLEEELNAFTKAKGKSFSNPSVVKDTFSLVTDLAKGAVHKQISESYASLSQQIDTSVDQTKYPHLYVFLHNSNDTLHKDSARGLDKVVKNEGNLFFSLLDDLKGGKGISRLESLISMNQLPSDVLKDILALSIEVGGNSAEEAIKGYITSQIETLYQKEGQEWTSSLAKKVGGYAGDLVEKLKEKATGAVRNPSVEPGFYERTMTSWTMSGPWGSGAHLAFAKPESGVDVLVRLGAVMVGDGGLVSSAATELIVNLIPKKIQNSEMSKQIADKLQQVAKPAKAISESIEDQIGRHLDDEDKRFLFQAVATAAVAGEGIMGNYATAVAVPAVGAVLDHFGLVDKKHFETNAELEDVAIRIGAGVVTTGVAEAFVRPAFGDEAAHFTYVASNLATTVAMPTLKKSEAWQGAKNIVYKGSVSVASHFMKPKESDPRASDVGDATVDSAKEEKPSLLNRAWGWFTAPSEDDEEPFLI